MATVKLVDENSDHPIVRRVFADIKESKKIDRVPNIWRAWRSTRSIWRCAGHRLFFHSVSHKPFGIFALGILLYCH